MRKKPPEASMDPRMCPNDQWGEVSNMVPMSEMVNHPRELDDLHFERTRKGFRTVATEAPLRVPDCGYGFGMGHRTHTGGRKYHTGNEE